MRITLTIMTICILFSPILGQSSEIVSVSKGSNDESIDYKSLYFKEIKLSKAHVLALKSLQLRGTAFRDLKGLFAEQAYSYYSSNGGVDLQNEIYNGLYFALLEFNDPMTKNFSEVFNARGKIHLMNIGPSSILSMHENGSLYKWSGPNHEFDQISGYWKAVTVKTAKVSPSGSNLFMAGRINGKAFAEIIDLRDFSRKASISKLGSSVTDASYISDNEVLILDNHGFSLKLYKNQEIDEMVVPTEKLTKIRVNNKGSRLYATGANGNLYRYDIENGYSESVIANSNSRLLSLEINQNDSILAYGDSEGILHLMTRDKTYALPGHTAGISDIAFSEDGNYMATSSLDKTIRLWSLNDIDKSPIVFSDNNSMVTSLLFTKDNSQIAISTANRSIKFYPANIELMAGRVCEYLEANFSVKEWNRYIGESFSYQETCPNLSKNKIVK